MKYIPYSYLLSLLLVVGKSMNYLNIPWFLALLPALLSSALGIVILTMFVVAVLIAVFVALD